MEDYYDESSTTAGTTPLTHPPRVVRMNSERKQDVLPLEAATSFDSYAAVGRLSYAPATQTTVVTTTTTTTTSFPPILLKNPKGLLDRDPKLYPLATTPTPSTISKFCMDLGGKPACFEEGDDVHAAVSEVGLISGMFASCTMPYQPVVYLLTNGQTSSVSNG